MLSGYRSDLYDELLSDWRRMEFAAFTGTNVSAVSRPRERTEVVWCNRPVVEAELTLWNEVSA